MFFGNLGPGLITGAADDDPSGISTYSVTGAAFGYSCLWTALFCFPLMAAVQLMCARLGMVSGQRTGRMYQVLLSTMGAVGLLLAAYHCQRDQHRCGPRRYGENDGNGHRHRLALPDTDVCDCYRHR